MISLMFVHQTQFQRRLLLKYGQQMVLMDSTYKTVKYDLPLFFIAVLTNVGYFIVATFIVGHENRKNIGGALSVLKEWNEDWRPQAFMCDLDQREIGAIENTFQDCTVYTCAFHREQSWGRWLKKASHKAISYKDSVLKDLRRIAGSRNADELNGNITVLKDSEIYRNNPLFQRWMDTIWLASTVRWVRCFRTHTMEVRISTTNGIESMNKLFKEYYLNKHGATKTLSSLVTTVVQDFETDSQEKYERRNVLGKSTHRKYSADVPLFLHDRPKTFVKHCMARWDRVSNESVQETIDGFIVCGYSVDTDIPDCTCPDFVKSGWPCKHLLAIFQFFPSYSWDFLPEAYKQLPVFNLDDGQPLVLEDTGRPTSQPASQPPCSKSIRAETREMLAELNSAAYTIESVELLQNMNKALTDIVESVRQQTPQIGVLHSRSNKKKKQVVSGIAQSARAVQSVSSEQLLPDDELSKVLNDVWNSDPSEDPLVEVGPFTLRNNSFHYIQGTLSDEVVDASLHVICKSVPSNVLHVSCVIWTSIFCGQPSIHGLHQRENLSGYDCILGALNEGGCHWTLVVVRPKERQIIYMNPLGEISQGEQNVLHNWYNFMNSRFVNGLEASRPEGWQMISPAHAKQADGTSCGLYVIQLAENYLRGDPLNFIWTREQIGYQRTKLARLLLAVGGIPSPETEVCMPHASSQSPPSEVNVPEVSPVQQEVDMPHVSPVSQQEVNAPLQDEVDTPHASSQSPPSEVNVPEVSPVQQEVDMPHVSPVSQQEVNAPLQDEVDTPHASSQSPPSEVNVPEVSPVQQEVDMPHVSPVSQQEDNAPLQDEVVTPHASPQVPCPETAESPIFVKRKFRRTVRNTKRSSFVYEPVAKKQRKYCVCNTGNDGGLYWQCVVCKNWFQPKCIGILVTEEPEEFTCSKCGTDSDKHEDRCEVTETTKDSSLQAPIDNETLSSMVNYLYGFMNCSDKNCNEVDHIRHHSFLSSPFLVHKQELKMVGFGNNQFHEKFREGLAMKLKDGLLAKRLKDPRKPYSGGYYHTMSNLDDGCQLAKFLYTYGLFAVHYVLDVLQKEALIYLHMQRTNSSYEQSNKILKESEIDFNIKK